MKRKSRLIPVTVPQPDFYDGSEPRRVAVYARVATGDPRQTSSCEPQQNYFTKRGLAIRGCETARS